MVSGAACWVVFPLKTFLLFAVQPFHVGLCFLEKISSCLMSVATPTAGQEVDVRKASCRGWIPKASQAPCSRKGKQLNAASCSSQ